MKDQECCSCYRGTKYICINCRMPVCNLCSFPGQIVLRSSLCRVYGKECNQTRSSEYEFHTNSHQPVFLCSLLYLWYRNVEFRDCKAVAAIKHAINLLRRRANRICRQLLHEYLKFRWVMYSTRKLLGTKIFFHKRSIRFVKK
jgi:hypothetical protein